MKSRRLEMVRLVRLCGVIATTLLTMPVCAVAQDVTVEVNRISNSGVGEKIGTITISEGKGGLSFRVNVKGLPAGQRGFHVHESGDCGSAVKEGEMQAGLAAGAHYDPEHT